MRREGAAESFGIKAFEVMMIYETAALIGGYTIEDPGALGNRQTKSLAQAFGSASR